ncbi:MAG: hypothetical protein ABIO67_11530 [Mycobacteriales bacterium]
MSETAGSREQVEDLLGQLAGPDLSPRERGRLLVRLTGLLVTAARSAGGRAAFGGSWLVDTVAAYAPHVPVRDLLTLREHHSGLSGDALAEALVASACRVSAGIGAAGGALATAETAAPPTLLLAPVQLAAETVAVVAVELKLVAELHVVYGRAPLGTRGQVATAYLMSWAGRRAVDAVDGASMAAALGAAARLQLRKRVLRRLGRNVSTLAPFLAGAVAGAELNRRDTRALGDLLVKDLRRRR